VYSIILCYNSCGNGYDSEEFGSYNIQCFVFYRLSYYIIIISYNNIIVRHHCIDGIITINIICIASFGNVNTTYLINIYRYVYVISLYLTSAGGVFYEIFFTFSFLSAVKIPCMPTHTRILKTTPERHVHQSSHTVAYLCARGRSDGPRLIAVVETPKQKNIQPRQVRQDEDGESRCWRLRVCHGLSVGAKAPRCYSRRT